MTDDWGRDDAGGTELESALENPYVRHGVGLTGATLIAVVAFTVFEGTARVALLALAIVDFVLTPQILKYAVES